MSDASEAAEDNHSTAENLNSKQFPTPNSDDLTLSAAEQAEEQLDMQSAQLNQNFARIRHSVGNLEKILLSGPRELSRKDLAEMYQVSPELSANYWRGLGFTNTGYETAVFTQSDAKAIADLAALVDGETFTEETFVTLVRGIGFHQGRLAMWLTEALVDEYKQNEKLPDYEARMKMLENLPQFLKIFEEQTVHVFKRQLAVYTARAGAEVLRTLNTGLNNDALPLQRAVGFADLVQFTRLAQSIGGFGLVQVIKKFESICRDVISEGGGRVVKTVGDEVMFLADTPEDGVRIALSIAKIIEETEHLPPVRIGLAWGNMFSRYGDVFGPTVNLAARLEGVAHPGAVVVDEATAKAIARAFPGGFIEAATWQEDLHGIGLTTAVRMETGSAKLINLALENPAQ